MSGAIPFACDAVAAAPDAHQKLHAVALLTTCLQRMKECLEVRSLTIPVLRSSYAVVSVWAHLRTPRVSIKIRAATQISLCSCLFPL